MLRSAVKQCGVGNWTKIASLVPGRTQAQVYTMYMYIVHAIQGFIWGETRVYFPTCFPPKIITQVLPYFPCIRESGDVTYM